MTDNKFEAIYNLILMCPLVGYNAYFNFLDESGVGANTSLMTSPYGDTIKKYIDGEKMKKIQCEIRQIKPLAKDSNTIQNIEEMQLVQDFMDWINEQGKNKNYPDFGEKCDVIGMGTPEGVQIPNVAGISDEGTLYAFPFEITYLEEE